ncbi:MAG: Hint domain-containing protein [Pseudomonadota bacterium]
MPLTFSIVTRPNINDGEEALDRNFGSEANRGEAEEEDEISFDTLGDVRVTIEGDVFGDDNGSRLAEAITIGGRTFPAGTLIETDYSFIAFDEQTDLYFRISHVSINNQFVGAVISRGFDVDQDQVTNLYTPGNDLELVDPDPVSDRPGWQAFKFDDNYTGGEDDLYSNDVDLSDDGSVVVCFTAGTRIDLPGGETAPVEALTSGDFVQTQGGRPRPIRWIARRRLTRAQLTANPKLRPVRIAPGALGCGLPLRTLRVSRQHRILVSSPIAQRMFDTPSVLVAAIHLVGLPGIEIDTTCTDVEYVHFLLDQHDIVYAEGAPSESLFTGVEALRAVGAEARAELTALFPDLMEHAPGAAAPIPPRPRQRRLMARHAKNAQPVLRPGALR